MSKNKIIILLVLSLVMSSCSSGKKSFERGNYYEAVIKSIERLRSNPDNKKARQTLKDAYPFAVETLTTEIDNLLNSNEQFKYAGIVDRYEKINSMADEIRRSPAARSLKLDIREYTTQLTGAKEKAATEAYDAAGILLNKGDRESAKEAHFLYNTARQYVSNFRDVISKMDIAREIATLVVVVEDISVPGLYKINSEFFQSQIISYLADKQANNFILFLNPKDAKGMNRVDQVVLMQFDNFVVGSTHDKEVIKDLVSKDSVKVGSATIDGQKVDVFDKVKASYSVHTRELISSGILDVKIIDANSEKLIGNKKFPGKFVWGTEWASYNGDKRALNSQQLKLSKSKPSFPPPPQELFLEFTKPIFNQTKSYLNNYYRKH